MSLNGDQGIRCLDSNASCEINEPTAFTITPAPIFVVVISVIFETLLIPFILLGNGAVVLLVAKSEPLRTTTNAFMVSLAMADAMQGLTLIPVIVATLDPVAVNSKYICLTLWCSILLASGCSSLSLCAITVDRYVKIIHPLTYQQIINKTQVATAIAAVWIYTSFLVFILPFSGLNQIRDTPHFSCLDFTSVFDPVHLQLFLFTNGIIPFVLMCCMYFRLLIVVLEKLHQEGTQRINKGIPMTGGRWRFMKRELRSVKTFLILLGFTGLAWLPVTIVVLLEIHTGYRASLALRSVFSWLTFMNSAANPVVYTLRSEPFGRAARKTFAYRFGKRCCCFSKRKPKIVPLQNLTSRSLTTFPNSVADRSTLRVSKAWQDKSSFNEIKVINNAET